MVTFVTLCIVINFKFGFGNSMLWWWLKFCGLTNIVGGWWFQICVHSNCGWHRSISIFMINMYDLIRNYYYVNMMVYMMRGWYKMFYYHVGVMFYIHVNKNVWRRFKYFFKCLTLIRVQYTKMFQRWYKKCLCTAWYMIITNCICNYVYFWCSS